MSNIFKTNSRFAALANDIPAKKDNKQPINVKKEQTEEKFNSFKSDNNSFKNNGFRENRYNRYSIERERAEAQEKARKEEEERKKLSLTADNFPDLVLNKKEIHVTQEESYLEKLKKVEDIKDESADVDSDLKKLKPGWILLKKDKLTGKTIINGKLLVIQTPETIEDEEDIVINIIDELAELHERRTQEYIELNGYDTWEKMFKFPGWRERADEMEDDSDGDYEDESEDTEEEYI
jgi:hypothetical protein